MPHIHSPCPLFAFYTLYVLLCHLCPLSTSYAIYSLSMPFLHPPMPSYALYAIYALHPLPMPSIRSLYESASFVSSIGNRLPSRRKHSMHLPPGSWVRVRARTQSQKTIFLKKCTNRLAISHLGITLCAVTHNPPCTKGEPTPAKKLCRKMHEPIGKIRFRHYIKADSHSELPPTPTP